MATTILETKYDHTPSIRNGDAAFAARAVILLCDRGERQHKSVITLTTRCLHS